MISVGTGRATLEFPDDCGLFGFSVFGGRGMIVPTGSREHDRLEARALYLVQGERKVLIVSYDLASGSRVVQRALLDKLQAAGTAISAGELWVVGTHTHSAPGHYLGNFYDLLGQHPIGYRTDVVAEIVRKGLEAARSAMRAPVECRVGFAERVIWGHGRNRSLGPFLANFGGDPTVWERLRGVEALPGLTPEERAIDPRLRVIAFAGADGSCVASWASFPTHAATLHRVPLRPYHRDWPGVAVDHVDSHRKAFGIIHQSSNGDVTPLPSGLARVDRPFDRVREIGEAVGAEWCAAIDEAVDGAREVELELRYRSFRPAEHGLPEYEIGWSALAGSEEYDAGLTVRILGEARAWGKYRPGDQRPKHPALGPLQYALRLAGLGPSPEHPMWLLRLGTHVLFASPFEMTTYAAHTAAASITSAWASARKEPISASAISLVGDYAGYATTEAEFELQEYEGGNTLYGRKQLASQIAVWNSLVGRGLVRDASAADDATELAARASAVLRTL